MSNESLQVMIARMDERVAVLVKANEKAEDRRREQYEFNEDTRKIMTEMGNRMTALEGKFAKNQPTIEEFITIKHNVVTAGKFGRWAWVFGASLIGFLAGSREFILTWLKPLL